MGQRAFTHHFLFSTTAWLWGHFPLGQSQKETPLPFQETQYPRFASEQWTFQQRSKMQTKMGKKGEEESSY